MANALGTGLLGMLAAKREETNEPQPEDNPELTQILDLLQKMQSKQEDIKGQFKTMAESLSSV